MHLSKFNSLMSMICIRLFIRQSCRGLLGVPFCLALVVQFFSLSVVLSDDNANTSDVHDGVQEVEISHGQKLFKLHCAECHAQRKYTQISIAGTSQRIAPTLAEIRRIKDRQRLRDAIIDPGKQIADEFSQLRILTENGVDAELRLITDLESSIVFYSYQSGKLFSIPELQIGKMARSPTSPMPSFKKFSQSELSLVIDFLIEETREREGFSSPKPTGAKETSEGND